ncbi:hypothetical protein V2J09_017209 [Rumex salicifolius]
MEDVWKDINSLPAFHPILSPNPNSASSHHGPILRDFFTGGEEDVSAGSMIPPSFNRCGVNTPFVAMAASSSAYLLDSFIKKRSSEEIDCTRDRKYKRMMQNRESAVRSRARKTAYTIELEKEKAQLIEENARLRRVLQGQELFTVNAVAGTSIEDMGVPIKRNRARSLSALF